MKKTIMTASLALLLSACASNGGTTANADNAAQAIAAAETARKEAAAVGYEWRDTGKILKAAKKAAKEQDYQRAMYLAGVAERQSENAVKQQAEQMAAVSH
ncbi:MAG: SoxXA-binding protein [Pseudomonadota bacterium]